MKPIRQILVPTDFSEAGAVALEEALGMAQRFDANITLLHVEQLPIFPHGDLAYAYSAELIRQLGERTHRELATAAGMLENRLGRPVQRKSTAGSPVQEIVAEATRGGYDLIVIATHGRTGIAHALIGSVAERVVQLAPCRVLTVRSEARQSA